MNQNSIIIRHYASPCGDLLLGAYGDKLCLCDWGTEQPRALVGRRLANRLYAGYEAGACPVILEAVRQLDEYFRRGRSVFDIPLLLVGTEFQQQVWRQLQEIPYGETRSYADLARTLGRPEAVRAVARASGANALSIFLPCHRVVGSDGSLTGYAGGLEAKRFLLALENGGGAQTGYAR